MKNIFAASVCIMAVIIMSAAAFANDKALLEKNNPISRHFNKIFKSFLSQMEMNTYAAQEKKAWKKEFINICDELRSKYSQQEDRDNITKLEDSVHAYANAAGKIEMPLWANDMDAEPSKRLYGSGMSMSVSGRETQIYKQASVDLLMRYDMDGYKWIFNPSEAE